MKKIFLIIICFSLVLSLSTVTFVQANEPWKLYDFGGKTLTISQDKFMAEREYVGGFTGEGLEHFKWVEEKFNVKIEFVKIIFRNVKDVMLQNVLAGTEECSLYPVREESVRNVLAPAGLLYPIGNVLDNDYYQSLPTPFKKPFHTFKGVNYSIMTGYQRAPETSIVVWNKEMFDREGLPDLHAVYDAGNWTWDTAFEFAKKLTKDTDGDGVIDQWGQSGLTSWFNLIASNGGQIMKMDERNRMVVAYDEPNVIEALQVAQRMSVELPSGGNFITGKNVGMATTSTFRFEPGRDYSKVEFDFGIIALPKGPSYDKDVAPMTFQWCSALPINTSFDPKAIVEVVNALARLTDDYAFLRDHDNWDEYMKGFYSVTIPDRRSLEFFGFAASSPTVLSTLELSKTEYATGEGWTNAINEIFNNNAPIATTLSKYKPIDQAILDSIYNN